MSLSYHDTPDPSYDFIIAGAGCAGLSLLVHMIHSGAFTSKKILLAEKEVKNQNDRTWCFWESTPGPFEELVYRKWNTLWFHGRSESRLLHLSPYEYKLIRGIDFYHYCFALIRNQPNIDIRYGTIEEIKSDTNHSWIIQDGRRIEANFIFSSITPAQPPTGSRDISLLQHFRGWIIETAQSTFDPDQPTFMDFRVAQQYGTTFAYVLPFSKTRALVEYTLFSENALQSAQYDQGLTNYLHDILCINDFTIVEEESGVIPMSNRKYPVRDHHIIYLGTAGGQTKASSGYTFRFIQKHSAALVRQLTKTGNPTIPSGPKRFPFYDNVLLHILHHRQLAGDDIFTRLFKNNPAHRVLQFLDNETDIWEELKLVSSLPALPFIKAALHQL